MKRLLMALVMAPIAVAAQPSDVLLEACNALPDAAKRLECFKAATASPAKAGVQQAAANDAVIRAFGSMRSSLDVGISYNNYQIALLDLAKAVSQFKLDAGAAGVPAHKSFDAAVTAYSDAGTLWQKSIEFFAQRGNAVSYGGSLPVDLTGTQWLIPTYNLPTQKADLFGLHTGISPDGARRTIWAWAKAKEDEGFFAITSAGKTVPAQAEVAYSKEGDTEVMGAAIEVAKIKQCRPNPTLTPTVITPEMKEFLISCVSGSVLQIQCTSGVCRDVELK